MSTADAVIELLADEDSQQYHAARKLTLACWDHTDRLGLRGQIPTTVDHDSYVSRRLLSRELASMDEGSDCCWFCVAGELLRAHVLEYLPAESEVPSDAGPF